MQSLNSRTIELFKDTLSLSKKHWAGWTIFWSLTFFILGFVFQERFISHPILRFISIAILQGGFPIFFFSVYIMNKQRLIDMELSGGPSKGGWLKLFTWVRDKGLLIRGAILSGLHITFYVILALATSGVSSIFLTNSSPSISVLGIIFVFQAILGTLFLALTWQMPALMAEGVSLIPALKTSSKTFFKSWQLFALFNVYLHIPTLIMIVGLYLSARGLQTFASVGRLPPPEKLVDALLETSPIGIYLVLIGSVAQFLFWLIFLVQGYSPLFWNRVQDSFSSKENGDKIHP